jgi:hypothetical protein
MLATRQAARHDEPNGISSIAAHPCKKRKDGAPAVWWCQRKAGPPAQKIEVKFSAGLVGDAMSEAHEGSHAADGSAWVASGFSSALNPTRSQTEQRAYRVTDTISEGLGNLFTTMSFGSHPTHTYLLDHIAWPAATKDAAISNIIKHEYPNSQLKAFQRNTRGGH